MKQKSIKKTYNKNQSKMNSTAIGCNTCTEINDFNQHAAETVTCFRGTADQYLQDFADGMPFESTTMCNVTFYDSTYFSNEISSTTFQGCTMTNSLFEGATITNSTFDADTNLTFSTFNGTDLTTTTFLTLNLQSVQFNEVTFIQTPFLSNTDLSNAVFSSIDFSNSDLSSLDFSNSTFNNCTFAASTHLANTKLINTTFNSCILGGTDLSKATFNSPIFTDTPLSNVDFSGANLSTIDFSSVDFTNSNLSNCTLNGTNFSGANLSKANLGNSDLTGANLSNANLTNCDAGNSTIKGVTFDNNTIVYQTNFNGCKFVKQDIKGLFEINWNNGQNTILINNTSVHTLWDFISNAGWDKITLGSNPDQGIDLSYKIFNIEYGVLEGQYVNSDFTYSYFKPWQSGFEGDAQFEADTAFFQNCNFTSAIFNGTQDGPSADANFPGFNKCNFNKAQFHSNSGIAINWTGIFNSQNLCKSSFTDAGKCNHIYTDTGTQCTYDGAEDCKDCINQQSCPTEDSSDDFLSHLIKWIRKIISKLVSHLIKWIRKIISKLGC